MKSPVLEAFDKCPNRKTRDTASSTESVCPRYPRGIEIDNVFSSGDIFQNPNRRTAVAQKLGCAGCSIKDRRVDGEQSRAPFEGYHPVITEECQPKFEAGHYDDAVFTGIVVVRDKLRELTGFEKTNDAFGRGELVIAGSANAYTDNNFQQAAKFLMLANDNFRNELAHTNDQNDLIKNPDIALQFLGISSISMYMLDGATTAPRN